MKVATIIHTRTFRCDFNSNFMVRPEDFTDIDIKWARKFVLSATSSIDNLNGERWLVADDGKHRIAGIACFVNELAKLAGAEDETTFFMDEHGRNVYAFVGIVVKSSETVESLPTYKDFWNSYKSFVAEKWERTVVETTLSPYEKKSFSESLNAQKPIGSQKVTGKEFFESSPSANKQLFSYYFGNIVQNNSFCSNLIDFSSVKSAPFSILTTSANTISRLKQETLKREENQNATRAVSSTASTKFPNTAVPPESEYGKKKSSTSENQTWKIIVLVIILFVFGTVIIKNCTESKDQTGTTRSYQSYKKN